MAKHVTENEKLLEEIAQLRTRLVAKAETIGAMQFSNVSDIYLCNFMKPILSWLILAYGQYDFKYGRRCYVVTASAT